MARRSIAGSLLLLIALTACVSRADGPSPTDPHGFTTTTTIPVTATTSAVAVGVERFGECMSDRGVGVGQVSIDGLGRPRLAAVLSRLDLTDRDVLEALEVCGGELTAGALSFEPDPELGRLVREGLARFSECVRARGVGEFPDPIPDFDGVGSPYPVNRIPWSDPDLAAALATCRDGIPDT